MSYANVLALERWKQLFFTFVGALCVLALVSRVLPMSASLAKGPSQHNAIIFVADGLRPSSVNATEIPPLYNIGQRGVSFPNSHSLFPTFTTANESLQRQDSSNSNKIAIYGYAFNLHFSYCRLPISTKSMQLEYGLTYCPIVITCKELN